jgi:Protein of unknown function (DUF2877)
MAVTAIGWRAHAALVASGGRAEIVAPLSTSYYAHAAGELVWVVPPGTPLHPRAILVGGGAIPTRNIVHLGIDGRAPWRPDAVAIVSPRIHDAARRLHLQLRAVGEPRGLGRLLTPADEDDAVVLRARPHARALEAACRADDPTAMIAEGRQLLGLGGGLTPSGDDYLGGLLFGWRLIGRRREADAWDAAAVQLAADAMTLSHPISARLFADLAAGEGWAPLHDLVQALAATEPERALQAARGLTAVGQTSGWDVLAGLLGSLGAATRR